MAHTEFGPVSRLHDLLENASRRSELDSADAYLAASSRAAAAVAAAEDNRTLLAATLPEAFRAQYGLKSMRELQIALVQPLERFSADRYDQESAAEVSEVWLPTDPGPAPPSEQHPLLLSFPRPSERRIRASSPSASLSAPSLARSPLRVSEAAAAAQQQQLAFSPSLRPPSASSPRGAAPPILSLSSRPSSPAPASSPRSVSSALSLSSATPTDARAEEKRAGSLRVSWSLDLEGGEEEEAEEEGEDGLLSGEAAFLRRQRILEAVFGPLSTGQGLAAENEDEAERMRRIVLEERAEEAKRRKLRQGRAGKEERQRRRQSQFEKEVLENVILQQKLNTHTLTEAELDKILAERIRRYERGKEGTPLCRNSRVGSAGVGGWRRANANPWFHYDARFKEARSVLKGAATAESASLGPGMLAPDVGQKILEVRAKQARTMHIFNPRAPRIRRREPETPGPTTYAPERANGRIRPATATARLESSSLPLNDRALLFLKHPVLLKEDVPAVGDYTPGAYSVDVPGSTSASIERSAREAKRGSIKHGITIPGPPGGTGAGPPSAEAIAAKAAAAATGVAKEASGPIDYRPLRSTLGDGPKAFFGSAGLMRKPPKVDYPAFLPPSPAYPNSGPAYTIPPGGMQHTNVFSSLRDEFRHSERMADIREGRAGIRKTELLAERRAKQLQLASAQEEKRLRDVAARYRSLSNRLPTLGVPMAIDGGSQTKCLQRNWSFLSAFFGRARSLERHLADTRVRAVLGDMPDSTIRQLENFKARWVDIHRSRKRMKASEIIQRAVRRFLTLRKRHAKKAAAALVLRFLAELKRKPPVKRILKTFIRQVVRIQRWWRHWREKSRARFAFLTAVWSRTVLVRVAELLLYREYLVYFREEGEMAAADFLNEFARTSLAVERSRLERLTTSKARRAEGAQPQRRPSVSSERPSGKTATIASETTVAPAATPWYHALAARDILSLWQQQRQQQAAVSRFGLAVPTVKVPWSSLGSGTVVSIPLPSSTSAPSPPVERPPKLGRMGSVAAAAVPSSPPRLKKQRSSLGPGGAATSSFLSSHSFSGHVSSGAGLTSTASSRLGRLTQMAITTGTWATREAAAERALEIPWNTKRVALRLLYTRLMATYLRGLSTMRALGIESGRRPSVSMGISGIWTLEHGMIPQHARASWVHFLSMRDVQDAVMEALRDATFTRDEPVLRTRETFLAWIKDQQDELDAAAARKRKFRRPAVNSVASPGAVPATPGRTAPTPSRRPSTPGPNSAPRHYVVAAPHRRPSTVSVASSAGTGAQAGRVPRPPSARRPSTAGRYLHPDVHVATVAIARRRGSLVPTLTMV